jgi:hypothetical protein
MSTGFEGLIRWGITVFFLATVDLVSVFRVTTFLDTTTDFDLDEDLEVVAGVLKEGVAFKVTFLTSTFSEVFVSTHHPAETHRPIDKMTTKHLAQ